MAAYNNIARAPLTPSRPAPAAPRRQGTPQTNSVGESPGGTASSSSLSPHERPVRSGYVSVKEDGFGNWLWSKKWLVLREETLVLYRNEVSGVRTRIVA